VRYQKIQNWHCCSSGPLVRTLSIVFEHTAPCQKCAFFLRHFLRLPTTKTFTFGPLPNTCTSYVINILFREPLTRAATPHFYCLQCGHPRAIGYHAGTPSNILFFSYSRDCSSQSASHHATMCHERHLRRLLQPLSKLPPFHILTLQFCTAVSIDTCTAIARFFVGFGKIHAKIPISGCDHAQKPRLKPELSLSLEGLGLKARARNSSSPGSRKPSLSRGFQAEPSPHITRCGWASLDRIG
jgi:hypothetical protein